MIIRKCDFCGVEEGVEEVRLLQPNATIMKNSIGIEIARYRQPGVYYEDFDLCSECQDKIFNAINKVKKTQGVKNV